jgi:F-type H+-transporting ATPase subunit beta
MSVQAGKIAQIIGPVIDITFNAEGSELPKILDALEVTRPDGVVVTLECQQHIGENTVRAISMDSTDGLSRGTEVRAVGRPITMPIGDQVNGRLFNVVGDAIDGLPACPKEGGYAIHKAPPRFEDLTTAAEVFSQVSRLLTLLSLMQKVVKSVCSVVPVWARPY